MFLTLFVFHFEISGNVNNDWQSQKKFLIFLTLFVFHLDISGIVSYFMHPLNIFLM